MNLFRKLRSLFRKEKLESEMAEEMRLHVELQAELNRKAGMSADEARFAALRQFGNVASIQEQAREVRGWVWLEQIWQDLRHATRSLGGTPGFAAAAVLSLALAIGANTAIFSFVNEALLKPIPVRSPDELILLQWEPGRQGGKPQLVEAIREGPNLVFSQRVFDRLREDHVVLEDLFATAALDGINITVDHQTEVGSGQAVSGNFFQVLGLPALRGRLLLPEDDKPGAAPVAVISRRYWLKRFGGELAVLDRTISINRVATTIVGIMPDSIGRDITLPLAMIPQLRTNDDPTAQPGLWWLRLVGRLKPRVTMEQAIARLEGIFQEAGREDVIKRNDEDLPRLRATAGGQWLTGDVRQNTIDVLVAMMGMVGLVLLAACANVANLLLARGATRRREIAVRLALGATRSRLIRQLLIESGLLGLLGAGFGLLFSRWNLALLAGVVPPSMPLREWLSNLPLDVRGAGFAAMVGLLTSIIFGLAPALRATRLNLTEEFQGGPRSLGRGALSRLSQLLVVVQVAVSLVLLVGTGLFMRTLNNIQAVDFGINRSHLLLFTIDGNGAGYRPQQFARLHQEIVENIGALPGIRSVTYSGWPIISGHPGMFRQLSLPALNQDRSGMWNPVAARFFETYEMPLVAGRVLDERDRTGGAHVAVINQTLAGMYFPNENAVGHHIIFEGPREIVGVVRDAKQTGYDWKSSAGPMVFTPFPTDTSGHAFLGRVTFVVRTESAPQLMVPAIRKALGAVDPNLAPGDVHTQDEAMEMLFLTERMFARLAGFVGLLALALAGVGLFGLMSYSVVRRTGEIGIRMALGALPGRVHGMIIRESLSIVLVGVIAGIAMAYACAQVVAFMLFGVSPTDPVTYGAVVLFLFCVALVACWLPARRATKVDPMIALRTE